MEAPLGLEVWSGFHNYPGFRINSPVRAGLFFHPESAGVPQPKVPLLIVCLALLLCACAGRSVERQSLWNALSHGGYVLLMPPASAPDNETQRTPAMPKGCAEKDPLSEQGHIEAQRLKQELQSHAVAVGRVLTGSDCRCVMTAGIVFGTAEPWSIIDDAGEDDARMRQDKNSALREAISRWKSEDNLALVTHGNNIRDALGVDVQPGEVLVIEPMGDAGYHLLGQLPVY